MGGMGRIKGERSERQGDGAEKHDQNRLNLGRFDIEKAQIEPVLVMVFGLIALSFAPFRLYSPHAPQAGPQKTLQICVFLLLVASLDDFTDVSDTILMTS